MKSIILGIKGFFIGIANIIPGVSGGTLAITLGIYEKLISCISHFFKNLKENIKFLLPIGIGAIISILVGSKVISYALNKYTLATILFFIGLIIGGIPLLNRKIKNKYHNISNIIIFIFTFSFVIVLSLLKGENIVSFETLDISKYISLFLVGVVAAATMIIPGVSGSFVLMLLGFYKPIIDCINALTKFDNIGHNMLVLVPFGIGVIIGFAVISKLLEYLFKKYETKTYFGVMGFVLSSIITIFTGAEGLIFSVPQLIVGIILFVIGFFIAYKLGE